MRWRNTGSVVAAGLLAAACSTDGTGPLSPDAVSPSGPQLAVAGGVSGAAFTTTNPAVDGAGHCKNGNEAVNCNIYDGKQYVWMNGGPQDAGKLENGTYFFAVLAPGGQGGGQNPNDGTTNNLSDLSPTTSKGAGDAYTARIFTVNGGTISYSGPHDYANNTIRLMPYDDTPNNGGVYILAICRLGDIGGTLTYPVVPSACKYDAFKVRAGDGTGSDSELLTVAKTAAGGYTTTYAWDIAKVANPTFVNASGATATITYNVTVSRNAAGDAIGGLTVAGKITVSNPNPDNVEGVTITDALSNGTVCTVTGGANVTVGPGDSEFDYSCAVAGSTLPAGLDNVVKVDWPEQMLNTGKLAAGPAQYTFEDIAFAQTGSVNETVNVTDLFNGGSSVPIGTLLSPAGTSTVTVATAPRTFTYTRSVAVARNQCVVYPNTATITETGATASASVTVCGPIGNGFTLGYWSNKNGGSVLCANDQGWRNLLNTLNLRNANGSSYMVSTALSCAKAHASFSAWLLNGSATNMSYMLSVQLAATRLNVAYKGLSGTSLVLHPTSGLPVTINSVIAEAVAFLAANPNTTASGAARTTAQAYKNLFDALNNNQVFALP